MLNSTSVNTDFLVNFNNFVSTKETRKELLKKLNTKEQKMFKYFVASVIGK